MSESRLVDVVAMTVEIRIGSLEPLKRVHSVRIESGWEALTDTAEIKIPRYLYFANEELRSSIKAGDAVEIWLGYNGLNRLEFSGFVTKVTTDMPVVVKCEDYMWKLKQVSVNRVFKKATLKSLLAAIIPEGIKVDAADLQVGDIAIERSTVAKVLQTLKDQYGIYSYMNGNTLVSGKVYLDNNERVEYGFEKNIIAHDLKYRTADEVKIKVTAECIRPDGTKMTAMVGDADGEESKLVYSGITDINKLEALAKLDLQRLKIDGYSGSLTSFGLPFVQHGATAHLESKQYPERAGNYYVDAVTTSWSPQGFRRDVRIGKKAS